jgi:hypothetical protein
MELKNSTNSSWRDEYKRLYLLDMQRRRPVFFADSQHPEKVLVWPKVSTANGLTKAICNFLTWKGHYTNRINTQGQARTKKIPKYNLASGKIEHLEKTWYTKSTTRKGTADIDAIVQGRPVKIEVKVGADRLSQEQREEMKRVQAAGGLYYVAREMQTFYDWYTRTFENDDPDLYCTPEGYSD